MAEASAVEPSTGAREVGYEYLTVRRRDAHTKNAKMSADGYSAKKTKINEDKLADWLREQVAGRVEIWAILETCRDARRPGLDPVCV